MMTLAINGSHWRRALLPLSVFVATILIHFLWTSVFPETDPAQSQWLDAGPAAGQSWARTYIETQGYWLGYSYALSLSFAVFAFRQWREQRRCTTRNLAIGGLTLSGFLAVAGCFLIGCCGSPMLVVYLNLFGVSFLPFAKPMVAGFTTLSVIGMILWMNRRGRLASEAGNQMACSEPECGCE